MPREDLVKQAIEAGRNAKHNLQLIRQNPEMMIGGNIRSAEEYLNMMINLAEKEMKNARRAGRALRLRSRLMTLLSFILAEGRQKSKGGTA
ncbi:hypothetical protein RJP21_30060 [Paenibacillus sp. VCA1]|uniref:hypothetical protein n=1 Tax=Paenibacillus sp. VCA1 TaxID=3039148 RepID=UPI002872889A|nr:hypothetical protein [Paenibacillus sp. VCA1]MDR9857841.1 hypothetical protein [Paenibacillus sp. VCA1]